MSFDSTFTCFVFAETEEFDEDDESIDSFFVGGEGQQDSLVVNAGPGEFTLDVSADTDESFTVTVENCGGETGGNDAEDVNAEDEDADDDGVIDDTVPNKNLPNTGGSSALVVGGTVLFVLYGGLVAWRLKTRRG